MEMTVKCKCGKKKTITVAGEGCYNLAEAQEKSGFTHCMTVECKTIWLCPDCSDKAFELADQLQQLTGTKDIHFSSLHRQTAKHYRKPTP